MEPPFFKLGMKEGRKEKKKKPRIKNLKPPERNVSSDLVHFYVVLTRNLVLLAGKKKFRLYSTLLSACANTPTLVLTKTSDGRKFEILRLFEGRFEGKKKIPRRYLALVPRKRTQRPTL